jgi:hypothetical protein
VRRTPALVALSLTTALATAAALAAGTSGAAGAAGATRTTPSAHHLVARGGPGTWTKISKSTVGIIYRASMTRTSDGILHVVYPRDVSGGGTTIAHTALNSNGSIVRQNDVLSEGWSTMDTSPIAVNGASGLHTLFGGTHDISSGFFDSGRMFMADAAGSSGASWSLPAQNVGLSNQAYASYGTGAVELADGTPVADFPLNKDLTWHVGTSSGADGTYHSPQCCVYDTTLVRDGSNVWLGWYQNGGTTATNGTFAMKIYPTVGTPLKAPGSSGMSLGSPVSIDTGRVALAARVGGGVYEAYCVGYPSCTKVRLWKVGTSQTSDVPHSTFVAQIGLSAGPSGRLWIAWSDNIPKVHAVRTGVSGMAMGAVQNVGVPHGHNAVYSLAVEGSRGRGDLVINVGDGFWHTQVLAGLSLSASPSDWHHGGRKHVSFTVTDAHSSVSGAWVKAGSLSCHTTSHGTCAISFPSSYGTGKHTVTASKSGYTKATATLKVS